jgi:ssDNA-binding Zn-finger/Zn-ribbon topoisomerase 1
MSASGCEVCGNIPDFAAADLREGERLPEAVLKLVDAYPHPEGFWDTSKEYEITKRCPACGQLYTYSYYYEFSVGYVEERAWIERRR